LITSNYLLRTLSGLGFGASLEPPPFHHSIFPVRDLLRPQPKNVTTFVTTFRAKSLGKTGFVTMLRLPRGISPYRPSSSFSSSIRLITPLSHHSTFRTPQSAYEILVPANPLLQITSYRFPNVATSSKMLRLMLQPRPQNHSVLPALLQRCDLHGGSHPYYRPSSSSSIRLITSPLPLRDFALNFGSPVFNVLTRRWHPDLSEVNRT
jgi:hypothetical protein